MTVVGKQCTLCSQSHSRFPGLALVPLQPSCHACLEIETCLSAMATPPPKLKQVALACLHLQKRTGSRTCLIPCQSNIEATPAFKSSSVLPGGCSPRSHHCVMRCQGKSDSRSLTAPQIPGGWGSPAISSGVAPGDLHWAEVTVSRAKAQGEVKHLLQR